MSESESNEAPVIYVGRKPLIRYVMAAMAIILNEGPKKLKISARGRAISRAVDVAEVLRTRYLPGILDVESIKIGTDEIQNPQNPDRIDRVSTIEITLLKKREIVPATS
ncbi:MAG: DNA-binding protein Alba [Candidatus Njordarchaeia archaeon]|nr:DNA-binding protein Alba [Candidatus Korarchaeota archaeon]